MLKTREELSVLCQTLEGRFASQVKKILVCAGTGCVAGGSLDIYARLVELLQGKASTVRWTWPTSPTGTMWASSAAAATAFAKWALWCVSSLRAGYILR